MLGNELNDKIDTVGMCSLSLSGMIDAIPSSMAVPDCIKKRAAQAWR